MSARKKPGGQAVINELRADIAETRIELGETVEALAAKADVKERMKETVRRWPVNWTLVAAGVVAGVGAILVLTGRRSRNR
jgi:hypothetical protein